MHGDIWRNCPDYNKVIDTELNRRTIGTWTPGTCLTIPIFVESKNSLNYTTDVTEVAPATITHNVRGSVCFYIHCIMSVFYEQIKWWWWWRNDLGSWFRLWSPGWVLFFGLMAELNNYKFMKTEPLSTAPLHFWRMTVFPTVAVQAKDYCPCQQRQYLVNVF